MEHIEKPKHYMVLPGVEAIDIIAELTKDLKGVEAVCLGNILKYSLRCTKKGKMLEDLKKAKQYIKILEESPNGK